MSRQRNNGGEEERMGMEREAAVENGTAPGALECAPQERVGSAAVEG